MTLQQVGHHAQFSAHASHLILEEQTQRLDELQLHLLRQAAHVVMTLDHRARDGERLDDVRIDRALTEPAYVVQLVRLLVEDVDEAPADDLTLLLGVGDAGQLAVELRLGVDADHVQSEMLVVAKHVLKLVFAKQAVVDEDARQAAAYGAVEQDGRDGRVDATGERQNDTVVAELSLQSGHGGFDKGGRRPVAGATALGEEVVEQTRAALGVEDFRVELYAPGLLAIDAEGSRLHIVRPGNDAEGVRQPCDRVAVRHPHLRSGSDAVKQWILGVDLGEECAAVFARGGRLDASSGRSGQQLCAVADAEHGVSPA